MPLSPDVSKTRKMRDKILSEVVTYQVVYGLFAYGVDYVDEELEDED